MSAQEFALKAWDQTSYFMKCSDCEGDQEECFSREQAAEFAVRDGWRLYGSRVLCPNCAFNYPENVLAPKGTDV